eukprot:scaffold98562_cov60-Phaeocystis_antarctica.AAC.1
MGFVVEKLRFGGLGELGRAPSATGHSPGRARGEPEGRPWPRLHQVQCSPQSPLGSLTSLASSPGLGGGTLAEEVVAADSLETAAGSAAAARSAVVRSVPLPPSLHSVASPPPVSSAGTSSSSRHTPSVS